jgi:PPOX class probable F420-dependent enzyme
METNTALDFARTTRQSVLTTIKSNGRPQLSNVLHKVYDDGGIRISVTADRAKYKNLAREPWAALHVTSDDFWAYVVLEGDVELSEVVAAPDDEAAEALVEYYRSLMGEHDDWDDYRRALVADRRVLVTIRPTHAYGMLQLPTPGS